MHRKIATLFIGIVLLASLPLTIAGMLHASDAGITIKSDSDAEIELQVYKNVDSPVSQGDIRNIKHSSHKIRSFNDLKDIFNPSDFSGFIINTYFNLQSSAYPEQDAAIAEVPLFIRYRTLII